MAQTYHYQILYVILICSIVAERIDTECRQNGDTTVDCSNSGLMRVPDNIPVNTTVLDLSLNNITMLYNNDFHHLVHLLHLDLSINPISRIEVMSFNGLSSLLKLELYGHHLIYSNQSLPLKVFEPLQSLDSLSLRSKKILLEVHGYIFQDLSNLTELIVDTTPAMSFDSGFSRLIKLNRLIVGETSKLGHKFNCGISYISNGTFVALSKLQISMLDLSSCVLQSFEKGSLKPLPFLKTFIFKDGIFQYGNLSNVIEALSVYKNKNMSEITISNLYSNDQYSGRGYVLSLVTLSQICITSLDLSNDYISLIDFDVLLLKPPKPLMTTCVKHVYLNRNRITGTASRVVLFMLIFFSNLETLDFSAQAIFEYNHIQTLADDIEVDIQKYLFGVPIPLPPKLKHFNMAGGLPYFVRPLVDAYFFFGRNVEYLNVSFCGLYQFNHKIVGLENLNVLDFSGNDMRILSETFFYSFPNLTHLRLSHAFLDNYFLIYHGKRLLSPLQKLEILDLSFNDLVSLPNNIFDSLLTIQEINLANNKLVNIPDVSSLVNLNHLYLNNNALTTIKRRYREMLDITQTKQSNFHASLFGNTFSCSCASTAFLMWLQETNVILDGRNYSCMNMDGEMTTTESIHQNEAYYHRTCSSEFWLNLAIGGLSLIFVVYVTTFVIVKNTMRFQLFILRMIGQNVYPRHRRDFVYDANIISTTCSNNFIATSVEELERRRGLKLSIGNRDQSPNRPELITIAEAMRDSWKIVLILTNDFLKSNLSYYIMCNCLSAITLTTPDRLILLVDRGTDIPADICFLLDAISQSNIFNISIEEPLGQEFWNKLSGKISEIDTHS